MKHVDELRDTLFEMVGGLLNEDIAPKVAQQVNSAAGKILIGERLKLQQLQLALSAEKLRIEHATTIETNPVNKFLTSDKKRKS